MAQIGVNGVGIIINGTGYVVKPGSYDRDKKRHYTTKVTGIPGLNRNQFIDAGPLYDQVRATLNIYPNLNPNPYTSDAYSVYQNLNNLYLSVNTSYNITLPTGETIACRFTHFKENIPEESNFVSTDGGATFHPNAFQIEVEFLKS